MAYEKISELSAATATAAADLLTLVQSGTTKKISITNFLANLDGDVIPLTDNTYDFGSTTKKWQSVNTTSLNVGNDLTLSTGSLYFGNSGSIISLILDTAMSSSPGNQILSKKRRGTMSSPTSVQDGDILFQIYTEAQSNTSLFAVARLDFVVDGSFTTGNIPPSKINFYTNLESQSQQLNASLGSDGIFRATAFGIQGGADGVSFGPGAVTSITVVNGIITAIS